MPHNHRQNSPRPDTQPDFEIFEKDGKVCVGMPFNHTDNRRVFVRLGDEIIRLSYADPILIDLKPVPMDQMALLRRLNSLCIAEKDDTGKIVREYEAPIVAKD